MTERLLYLVRHGETVGQSSTRFWGRHDVDLSEIGREQVVGLVEYLRHVPFSTCVHSPMSRARESAEILLGHLPEPPVTVEQSPDLTEVDFGDMEGLTEAEVASSMPEFYAQWKGGSAKAWPNGESFAGFHERVAQAFDGMLARHPVGNLLIVAHKGIVKRGMAHLLELSDQVTARLQLDLGSLSVLRHHSESGYQLQHLNLTSRGT